MIAITADYRVKSRHGVQMVESVIKKADRPCKLVGYEGASHGFFNSSQYSGKTLAEADRFLVDLGWLKK